MTDWREIDERLELRDRKLERAILSDVDAQRALRKLIRGGVDRNVFMRLLVRSVHDQGFWRKSAHRMKGRLESIANQLETVARHAERVHKDYLSLATTMTSICTFIAEVGQRRP